MGPRRAVFLARIKTVRETQQLTQTAMFKATGIKQPLLSKIEQGHDLPSADAIDKIAGALQRSSNGTKNLR